MVPVHFLYLTVSQYKEHFEDQTGFTDSGTSLGDIYIIFSFFKDMVTLKNISDHCRARQQ